MDVTKGDKRAATASPPIESIVNAALLSRNAGEGPASLGALGILKQRYVN